MCRASPQCSRGDKSEQEGSAYPGHTPPCRATGQTLLAWFWVVPTCHQLASSSSPWPPPQPGLATSVPRELGQILGRHPEAPAATRPGHRSQQGLPLGQTDRCQLERTNFSIYMGNAAFSAVISQRGNIESKMNHQDSRYTSCVF